MILSVQFHVKQIEVNIQKVEICNSKRSSIRVEKNCFYLLGIIKVQESICFVLHVRNDEMKEAWTNRHAEFLVVIVM